MVIHVAPELEAALQDLARRQGVTPQALVEDALRSLIPGGPAAIASHAGWEQSLRGLARDCGVSLSDEAVGSDGLYE